jgi:hypothetical protein
MHEGNNLVFVKITDYEQIDITLCPGVSRSTGSIDKHGVNLLEVRWLFFDRIWKKSYNARKIMAGDRPFRTTNHGRSCPNGTTVEIGRGFSFF